MAALTTIIAAAGLAVAGFGAYEQYQGQKRASDSSQQVVDAQQAIEKQRLKQARLDAERKKRELVRQQIAARQFALSTTTNQGANYGSGLAGAYGGISGRTNVNELGVNQNLEIGTNIAGYNSDIFNAYRSSAAAGATTALGGGLETIGGAILRNAGQLAQIGTYTGSRFGAISSSYVA